VSTIREQNSMSAIRATAAIGITVPACRLAGQPSERCLMSLSIQLCIADGAVANLGMQAPPNGMPPPQQGMPPPLP
jgi:hypothetical protein